jgi:hypothetical protein
MIARYILDAAAVVVWGAAMLAALGLSDALWGPTAGDLSESGDKDGERDVADVDRDEPPEIR